MILFQICLIINLDNHSLIFSFTISPKALLCQTFSSHSCFMHPCDDHKGETQTILKKYQTNLVFKYYMGSNPDRVSSS